MPKFKGAPGTNMFPADPMKPAPPVDPAFAYRVVNCHKYSRFMHGLSHGEADLVFWLLFLFQIIILSIIVRLYDSVQRKYNNILNVERNFPNEKQVEELRIKVRRISKRCLAQTLFLFLLLLTSNVIQIFAAHAILFCHEESLMHLYFPVWTVFAIGITFATLGCCITQVYALKTMRLPPFGIALGTPILVISAITHLLYYSCCGRKRRYQDIEDGFRPALTQDTAVIPGFGRTVQPKMGAPTVSLANGPVIQIWTGEEPLPIGANAIGTTSQGYLIIEHVRPSSTASSESSRRSVAEGSAGVPGQTGDIAAGEASGQKGGLARPHITIDAPSE